MDLLRVDGHLLDFRAEDVSHEAARQAGLAVDGGRRADEMRLSFDALPLRDERRQLVLQRLLRDVLADGADDDAARILGQHVLDLRAQALPCRAVADLAAHADPAAKGMYTRKRPASDTCAVTRGPLVEIGSFET